MDENVRFCGEPVRPFCEALLAVKVGGEPGPWGKAWVPEGTIGPLGLGEL